MIILTYTPPIYVTDKYIILRDDDAPILKYFLKNATLDDWPTKYTMKKIDSTIDWVEAQL